MSETISKSRYARLPSFKEMSEADVAVVSKLVKNKDAGGKHAGNNRAMNMPDMSVLGNIANKTATNNNDAKNLFQVLPDMDLARSILISAILSPTDMVTTAVHYSLEANNLDDTLTGPMLRVIREFFDNSYKIKKFLPDMLSDALFMKGSYPLLVMPETSIDYSINSSSQVTLESLSSELTKDGWYRPYGILGTPSANGEYKTSFESLWDYAPQSSQALEKVNFEAFSGIATGPEGSNAAKKGQVYVTDNPAILSNPRLIEKLRKQRQSEIYGRRTKRRGVMPGGTTAAMENNEAALASQAKMTLDATEKLFYVNRQNTSTPMQAILTPKQLARTNKSNPLVMHLPSEAVIPVHVPGNVRHHIGYFVLLDISGNPLSIEFQDDYYSDIRASMNSDPTMSSQLLNMARRNTSGNNTWANGEIDQMQQAYTQAVENDLLNRLRSGAVTGDYQLANCEEVFRMMFSRSLAAKNTMLLYVPAELMTYICFDYNEYGVGKSLLEDGKILGSLRSVLLFASTMAAVRNSADTKNLNITLAEEDESPYETVAFMLGEYAKVNRSGFPIGETHPMQLVSHLQNAGIVVSVSGNTAYPETKLDVESREGIHKTVDKELDDELRRRHIQTFGLTPETMEASAGADFATTVVNQHIMLLKRVIQYQEEFTPFLTDFVRRYTLNSGQLFDELMEVVKLNETLLPDEYKGEHDQFVLDFIDLITLDLPSPETNRLEDQMRGFEVYTTAITTAMDAYLKAESLDPIAAQGLEEHMDAIKASILGILQRKYLREKNILPELDIFNTLTEEDGPGFNLMEETQEHLDGVLSSIEGYVKKMLTEAKKRAKRLEKQQADIDAVGGDEGGMDGELDGMDGDGGGDLTGDLDGGDDADGGGLDDGMDLDMNLDEPAEGDELPDDIDAEEPAATEDDADKPEEELEEDIDLDSPALPSDDDGELEEPETMAIPEEEEELDIDLPDAIDESGKKKT